MSKTFLEILYDVTGGKYSFIKVHKVEYTISKKKLRISLLVPVSTKFTDVDKAFIREKMSLALNDYNLDIVFLKTQCNSQHLIDQISKFFADNKPSLCLYIGKDDVKTSILPDVINIDIYVEPQLISLFEHADTIGELKRFLQTRFTEDFNIKYVIKEGDSNIEIESRSIDDSIISANTNTIKVKFVKEILGGTIISQPTFIKTALRAKGNNTVCGRVVSFKRIISKKNRPFYIFDVDDTTAVLTVKYFCRSEKDNAVNTICEGDCIILTGSVESSEYDKKPTNKEGLGMIARKINLCEIDFDSIVTEDSYNRELPYYKNIFPKEYEEFEQVTIDTLGQVKTIPEYLIGKTFVIFDLETTGLNCLDEEIIEIGAVKVVDGIITETFDTLINPQKAIPAGASSVNNIYDDMVKDAYTIEEVMGDFYKFCKNSIMVSYNIEFDMSFINESARKCDYKFLNTTICALQLARKLVPTKNHKLETVIKYYNISNTEAHRALEDSIATAKLFFRLAEKL